MLRRMVTSWLQQQAQEKLQETLRGQAESASAAREPPPACDVAVLFTLRQEAGGLVDRLAQVTTTKCPSHVEHIGQLDERFIVIAETNVGAQRASQAAEDVITLHHPRWLISAGFAGGLQPGLRRGHIVMAETLVDERGHTLATGMHVDAATVEATRGLHTGRLLTVDRVVAKPSEKRKLGEQYDALACDMETMAIAEVCRRASLPILSVRAIADAVDDQLKPAVRGCQSQDSLAAKLGAATGAVLDRPSSVKDFWQVKEDAIRISDRLANFLIGVIQQLLDRPSS